jgi:hypothetical protein
MLPTFLSSLLAHKILVIGKSINFIKLCIQRLPKKDSANNARDRADGAARNNKRRSLREINRSKKLTTGGRVAVDSTQDGASVDEGDSDQDGESTVDIPISNALAITNGDGFPGRAHDILSDITTPEVEAALLALRYGKEAHLSELVSSLSPSIDMRLLSLMRSRFHVEAHFSALKKFMLLGQGDFVTCLMDGVGPELKKRATQLFRHNLTGWFAVVSHSVQDVISICQAFWKARSVLPMRNMSRRTSRTALACVYWRRLRETVDGRSSLWTTPSTLLSTLWCTRMRWRAIGLLSICCGK